MQDPEIRKILTETRSIAVVGFSADPGRPSHYVAEFLQAAGYRIIPVNPGLAGQVILGETVYADLAAIPKEIAVDMVDIFRQSSAVPAIVEAALTNLPALRTIWMQIGVQHDAAAETAIASGKSVIMNRCPKIEYRRLMA
ncbi:CoA-binding protein [Sinirhodobacter sp. WL0062]|uniref:CoA-binding protein n=1 Tax=Rhodobacter flavimaris TaxID=2907145 RepID=A0ABS8YW59_9RHOB|nr:CoA-binding protein [Sinirhodobacter sp. WL0062]MCE5972686.1 CoA-binding protein [Sinirhodobacter sp. WL0062]